MTLPSVPDAPKSAEVLALEARDDVLATSIADHEERITALESRPPAGGGSAAVIPISSDLGDELAKLAPGQVAILRSPKGDLVVVVQ